MHVLLIRPFIQPVNQPFPAAKPGCHTPCSVRQDALDISSPSRRKLVWPSAPGQAIAGVKGQRDGKQCDLNLSEETSEEVFAGGFHSTCCPVTSSAGTDTLYPLHKKLST